METPKSIITKIKRFLSNDKCATHYKVWQDYKGNWQFTAAIGQQSYGHTFSIDPETEEISCV